MFSTNLIQLRKLNRMTQEDVAEKAGVTRQAVAKWEAGESVPDLATGQKLAAAFGVTLDDLVQHEPAAGIGLPVPPKGKHFFGFATVGEKGQIVIPAKARKVFGIVPGEQVILLGDEGQGLAILKADDFMQLAGLITRQYECRPAPDADGGQDCPEE